MRAVAALEVGAFAGYYLETARALCGWPGGACHTTF